MSDLLYVQDNWNAQGQGRNGFQLLDVAELLALRLFSLRYREKGHQMTLLCCGSRTVSPASSSTSGGLSSDFVDAALSK